MGKPMLWTMLVSLLFVLSGILIAATGGPLTTAVEAICSSARSRSCLRFS